MSWALMPGTKRRGPRNEDAPNDKTSAKSGEFQGYEFCRVRAGVRNCMGVVAGEPFRVAGFEVSGHRSGVGTLTFDVAADVEVGDGDKEVRAGVVVRGDDAAGLEFVFGGADAVLHKEDLFGALGKDFEAAVFVLIRVPLSG